MMKKFLLFFILLNGCGAIQPHYYVADYEDIIIDSTRFPQNVKAYIDEEEVEIISQTAKEINIRVPRTRENKILYLRRAGFKEIKIYLISQQTNELWADGGNKSAVWLAVPSNTIMTMGGMLLCIVSTPILLGEFITSDDKQEGGLVFLPPIAAAGWAITLPFQMAQDMYNMTVGVVSVNLKNPKYNYRIEDVEF